MTGMMAKCKEMKITGMIVFIDMGRCNAKFCISNNNNNNNKTRKGKMFHCKLIKSEACHFYSSVISECGTTEMM